MFMLGGNGGMRIPILDLSAEVNLLWDDLNRAVQDVLRSGQFVLGENVQAFEKEVAAYLGTKHAIGVNSGTDALLISLRAAGIGPGDEVITTPFTFYATAEAITLAGATPVFVDVDPDSFNIDPALAAKAVTSRTKALLPVHLYGLAAEMDALSDLANKHGLKIIEDVAQAFGGDYKGKRLGSIGDAGCFSFYPTKNLGAYGDAGLIATNNDETAEISRVLRVHGARKNYYNEIIGYNSRLDELQAAILRVKLPYVDEWNEKRRRLAARYTELLAEVPEVITPKEKSFCLHVYHQYTLRITSGKRDLVRQRLTEAGIGSMIYYPVPIHRLPAYKGSSPSLPVAERLAGEVLSLPVWPGLPENAPEQVVEVIKKAVR